MHHLKKFFFHGVDSIKYETGINCCLLHSSSKLFTCSEHVEYCFSFSLLKVFFCFNFSSHFRFLLDNCFHCACLDISNSQFKLMSFQFICTTKDCQITFYVTQKYFDSAFVFWFAYLSPFVYSAKHRCLIVIT